MNNKEQSQKTLRLEFDKNTNKELNLYRPPQLNPLGDIPK